jgi:hypothetical protein
VGHHGGADRRRSRHADRAGTAFCHVR